MAWTRVLQPAPKALGDLARALDQARRPAETGHLPNDDGAFNDRQMDRFLAGVDPQHHTWLITAAGKTAGFVMTVPAKDGGNSISGFFVVRALRRTGVGREAALQA